MNKPMTDLDRDRIRGRSTLRGHEIIYVKKKWVYADDCSDIPANGGEVRPCKRCGKHFAGSFMGDPDPCLGVLPGVNNACCGHGDSEKAYIRFTNGVVVKWFTVEPQDSMRCAK